MASDMRAHPWMANSAPGQIEAMLAEIGAKSVGELFEQIPADHFRKTPLNLPPALSSEMELKRDLVDEAEEERRLRGEPELPRRGRLAAPCARHRGRDRGPHRVRDERLGHATSPTTGAIRRGSSSPRQLGALLNLDVVQLPVYSWGCAIGHAIRMAARITGRTQVLVPAAVGPRAAGGHPHLLPAARDGGRTSRSCWSRPTRRPGGSTWRDLRAKLGPDVAAVYFENPAYLGTIETGRGRDRRRPRARRGPRRSWASTRSALASSRRPATTAPIS